MYLHIKDINPKILKTGYFNGYELSKEPLRLIPRVCYDYEFEFYLRCDGGNYIDDVFVPFTTNELNIKKPGQRICGVSPYECYIFCFSLDGKHQVPADYNFGSPEQASPLYKNEFLDKLQNKVGLQEHLHICTLFHQLYCESRKIDPLSLFNTNRILYTVIYELFKLVSPDSDKLKIAHPKIIRAIDQIKANLTDDIKVADLIEKSGLSKAYFNKCFKEYTETTPSKFITTLRMDKAKLLLCVSDHPVADIAANCGYYDQTYFAYLFKNETGFSPSVFRKKFKTQLS